MSSWCDEGHLTQSWNEAGRPIFPLKRRFQARSSNEIGFIILSCRTRYHLCSTPFEPGVKPDPQPERFRESHMSIAMERFASKGLFPTFQPIAAQQPRVAMFYVQCRSCGFE